MSYDPGSNTLFHYAAALEVKVIKENPYVIGQSLSITQQYPTTNTTIVARDIATGNVKWRYFYSAAQQRAAMVATPDVLFVGFTDGFMRFFDENTGAVLKELNLGSDMRVGLTTGQDSDGNQRIFTILGTGASAITPATPGTVVAIGLSAQAAPGTTATTTVTTTAAATTVTSTTTVPATTTTITSTLPGGITTTITSTIPAQTITTTIPGGVTTVTSSQAGGLPVEITYAVAAIAVIAIIAAAYLARRKR